MSEETHPIERRRLLGLTLGVSAAALGLVGPAAAEERVIAVVAKKFVFVPDQIMLTQGETVVLELTAPEVMMGFSAYDFGVRADIAPGLVTRVRLTAGKPGRYAFSCDVFCGSGHEEMDGLIVVQPAP